MRKGMLIAVALMMFALPVRAQVTGGKITGTGTITVLPFPTVTLLPTSIGFGNVTQGQSSASQQVTFTNTGTTLMNVASYSLSPASFVLTTTTCGATLAGGASCTLNITFTPTGIQVFNGTLSIVDNGTGSPHIVTLTGTGVASSVPVMSLTPSSLNFGSQTQNTSSASQPVTVQNVGGAGSVLSIASIGVSAQYSQTNSCPASLNSGASCQINVVFAPTGTGVISGTLTVTDNAAGSPHTSALTGTGVAPSGGIPQSSGWFSIPGTNYRAVVPTGAARADIQCNTGPAAIIDSWGGGTADQTNNRLYFYGGGHHDYAGNQAIKLDLNTLTVSQTSIPSTNTAGCNTDTETMPDGAMSARHTYDAMTFADGELWFMGGGILGQGSLTNEVWRRNTLTLNPAQTPGTSGTNSDTHVSTPSMVFSGGAGAFGSTHQSGNIMAYEPSTDTLFIWEPFIFNPGSVWKQTSKSPVSWLSLAQPGGTSNNGDGKPFNSGTQSGAIDSDTHVMYIAGSGHFAKALLTTPFTVSDVNGTGCTGGGISSAFPGIAYDSTNHQIVIWSQGNSITVYTPSTNTCSTETYTSGPTGGDVNYNGTLGRFQYFPQLGVFALCENIDENCFTLRRNVVNSFLNRKSGVNVPGGAASIVSSQDFNTFPVTNQQQYFQDFGNGTKTTDCTVAADGCSLHFTINAGAFQGEPGWFNYNFKSDLTRLVGPGDEIYIQWKQRVSASMLNPANFSNFEGWKLNIVSEGDKPGTQANNCSSTPTDFVLTSDATQVPVRPWIYENCGVVGSAFALNSGFQGIGIPNNFGRSDLLDQPASGGPHYGPTGGVGSTVPTTDPTEWNFIADEWFTVQEHIKIGAYGTTSPGAANSAVDVWFAHQGQPSVLITNAADLAIADVGGPSVTDKFGKIVLLPYATGATWNVLSNVWYDDLIVSNTRLPDDSPVPNAPVNLSSSVATGSITLNWTVNSNNGTAQDDTGFLVERCAGILGACLANPQSGFSQIGTTTAHAVTFTDSTTVAGTNYTYRIRANGTAGKSAYAVSICFNVSNVNACSTRVAQ